MTPRERPSDSSSGLRLSDSFVGRLRAADSTVAHARREESKEHVDPRALRNDPAVRNYTIACLAALVVILFVLLHQDVGTVSLMPVLIGIMGIVTRWRIAPLLLLGALTVLYYLEFVRYYLIIPMPGLERPELGDLVLAGAVLAYVAGHYRLQGLYHEIVPHGLGRPTRRADPRTLAAELPARRSTALVTPGEVPRLLLLVVWAAAAMIVWVFLLNVRDALIEFMTWVLPPGQSPYLTGQLSLRLEHWRALTLVWLLGVAMLVLNSLVRYGGYRRLSGPEALLFLQDAVWRETRREQTRINRWLAWARIRRQRREEAS